MRRNITLFASVMLASVVSAQTTETKPVPRPIAPGVDFQIEKVSAPLGLSLSTTNMKSAAQSKTVKIASAAPELTATDVAGYTPFDTLLVTGYTYQYEDDIDEHSVISYDEYGRRKSYITYGSDGNIDDELKYTYVVGAFNFWTSKTIEKKIDDSDSYEVIEKEEREINSQKQLARLKKYEKYDDYENNTTSMYLSEDITYDYEHQYEDEYTGEIVYGAEIEHINYDSPNEIRSIYRYQWFEPAQKYVEVYYENPEGSKSESTFEDNSIVETQYSYDSDAQVWIKQSVYVMYYADGEQTGYYSVYYDENGEVSSSNGQKSLIEKNTPSSGWTTTTNYVYDESSKDFKITSKLESYGRNLYNSSYGGNYEWNNYSYEDGVWTLYYSMKGVVSDNNIYEQYYSYNTYSTTSYYMLDDNDSIIGDVSFNDDKSYEVVIDSLDSDNNSMQRILYYDANNNLTKELLRKSGLQTNMGSTQSSDYTYYIKQEGEWVILSEFEITNTSGGSGTREVYKFNSEGYIQEIDMYAKYSSYNGGEEFLNEQTTYIYSDNGYRKEVKYANLTSSGVVLKIEDVEEYYLLSDGTYQHITLYYDDYDDNDIYSGWKTEEKDGVEYNYKYDTSANEFVLSSVSCSALETIAEDGTITIITREIDADNNVLNVSKSVSYEAYEELSAGGNYYETMNEYYTWDSDQNKWVGSYKNESKRLEVKFVYKTNNPIDLYEDEYLPNYNEEDYGNQTVYLDASNGYDWNDETDSWVLNSEYKDFKYELTDDVLTYTEITNNDYEERANTTTITRDSEYKLLSNVVIEDVKNLEDGTTGVTNTTVTYSYNENGYLQELKTIGYYNGEYSYSTTEKFEYSTLSVYPTPIEAVDDSDVDMISVNGNAIIVSDEQVELFNASGMKVTEGTGKVTAPMSGFYIVKINGKGYPVSVK